MAFEMGGAFPQAYRPPLYNLRWSAVFAGFVVAVALDVLLLLLGGAAALVFFNAGARASEQSLLTAANSWNAFCMVASATAGGYAAARASGMRRTADGVLHGVLAWGLAMLATLFLATSAGVAIGEVFSGSTHSMAAPGSVRPLDPDERLALLDILESRLGLTPMQANSVLDQILILSGRETGPDQETLSQALRAASSISGWLGGAVLLSLLGSIGGGVAGSRGARRVVTAPEPELPSAANEP